MVTVQGLLLQQPLGSSAAASSLPACGAVPVLRLVARLDAGGLTAPRATESRPERPQPTAVLAKMRAGQHQGMVSTEQRGAPSALPPACLQRVEAAPAALEARANTDSLQEQAAACQPAWHVEHNTGDARQHNDPARREPCASLVPGAFQHMFYIHGLTLTLASVKCSARENR